jgi:hypothetical protein
VIEACWCIVAALPPDGSVTFGDVVRLLRWFARGFNEGVEVDDGDE